MTDLTLTLDDDYRTIELQPGSRITVRLPENPTTGFRWHVDRIEGDVEQLDDSYEPGASPLIGGGGIRQFRFQFQGPGGAEIALKEWQPWEGESSVNNRFRAELVSLS